MIPCCIGKFTRHFYKPEPMLSLFETPYDTIGERGVAGEDYKYVVKSKFITP